LCCCVQDKQLTIPDDLGKDGQSVAALQRRLANFEHDLLNLGTQVCCCLSHVIKTCLIAINFVIICPYKITYSVCLCVRMGFWCKISRKEEARFQWMPLDGVWSLDR